ncbi:RNA polymerase sigma factor [Salmonirosea aquatica]|uniref:Sigma-70 family RNA polymerase sigma factor n=1 Tax=Salmonirosea aquatica TaxID=2654236 RepID=A0A7C9BK80_9BACT|nr:sigma-70 family RNA polymerase sigma factor [Cytophagaceae bacterium SJW1-29]
MLQVKAGQMDKMGLLFERYHRELFGYLYHMSGRPDVSEDIVQTVFYRMLKYRHTFTGDGSFRSWMYHLARNVLVDTAKENKRTAYHQDVVDYAERVEGGMAADEPLEKEQEQAALQDALTRLSPEHREVLVLSRFQELKYLEIAHILNISEGAVKVRVHRAMNELKKTYLKIAQ